MGMTVARRTCHNRVLGTSQFLKGAPMSGLKAQDVQAMRILPLLALALAASSSAFAQTERLPAMSRSERQVIETNRAFQQQQRDLRQDQQTQFEVNQLRNQLQQQQSQPIRPGCAIGVAC
jgi:hypothetical protein